MIMTFLMLTVQIEARPPKDLNARAPYTDELRAAERRERGRLVTIVRVCREAARSGDPAEHVRRFADANGLSTWARLALTTDCALYRQGVVDGETRRGRR